MLIILCAATSYFLLSYHIIFFGDALQILRKSRLTSEYTFVSVMGESPENIMRIDTLRKAGIGDLLVSRGQLKEDQKEYYEKYFDSDPVFY